MILERQRLKAKQFQYWIEWLIPFGSIERNTILIEGHTDNVPINNALYPNNMMLFLYIGHIMFLIILLVQKGYDKSTISSSGRGEAVPVATNDTPEEERRIDE